MSEQESGKSGIRILKAKEILFKENDPAESLYIIQRGQIRLFRPKGRGYVELAILRSGEVIGEMAYFDEKQRRRSASAEALVSTDVIEISFKAFSKTMANLNPWFKTIINTLANRLRSTNDRLKQLESNSVGFGRDGKVSDYKFFHNIDIVKMLSFFYLVMKTHGEHNSDRYSIHQSKIKFYMLDINAIAEVKYIEFVELLKDQGIIEVNNDQDGQPNIFTITNIERLRNLFIFFNTQRTLADEKQIKISPKCEIFLRKILDQIVQKGFKGDTVNVNISSILNEFKEKNQGIDKDDIQDAIDEGMVTELVVDKGNIITAEVKFDLLKKMYPSIRLMNAVKKVNDNKAREQS